MYHAGKLMRQLKSLAAQGKTIVIVLHDINQAAQFADTVVMMKSGQITAVGAPKEVLTADNIRRLYQVDVTVIQHQGKPVIIDAI